MEFRLASVLIDEVEGAAVERRPGETGSPLSQVLLEGTRRGWGGDVESHSASRVTQSDESKDSGEGTKGTQRRQHLDFVISDPRSYKVTDQFCLEA